MLGLATCGSLLLCADAKRGVHLAVEAAGGYAPLFQIPFEEAGPVQFLRPDGSQFLVLDVIGQKLFAVEAAAAAAAAAAGGAAPTTVLWETAVAPGSSCLASNESFVAVGRRMPEKTGGTPSIQIFAASDGRRLSQLGAQLALGCFSVALAPGALFAADCCGIVEYDTDSWQPRRVHYMTFGWISLGCTDTTLFAVVSPQRDPKMLAVAAAAGLKVATIYMVHALDLAAGSWRCLGPLLNEEELATFTTRKPNPPYVSHVTASASSTDRLFYYAWSDDTTAAVRYF